MWYSSKRLDCSSLYSSYIPSAKVNNAPLQTRTDAKPNNITRHSSSIPHHNSSLTGGASGLPLSRCRSTPLLARHLSHRAAKSSRMAASIWSGSTTS